MLVEAADAFEIRSLTSNARQVVGVSHAYVCPKRKQVWLEGIRINPKYRRNGIASELIARMIEYVKKIDTNIREAAAITADTNIASKRMLEKNGFQERAQWTYYTGYKENGHQTNIDGLVIRKDIFENNRSSVPTSDTTTFCRNMHVSFASIDDIDEIITFLSRSKTFDSGGRRFVQSWKWYELDLEGSKILELIARKKIIVVRTKDIKKIEGLAITNDQILENSWEEQIQGGDEGRKQITSEDDSGNNVDEDASFQLVYLDTPTSASLENLLVFVVNWVISSSKFDRIQLFMPNQMHNEKSDFYEISDVLAKFGISKSEGFLLYVRCM